MHSLRILAFILNACLFLYSCDKQTEPCDDGSIYHPNDKPLQSCFFESNYFFWHSEDTEQQLLELNINGLQLNIDGNGRMSWAVAYSQIEKPDCELTELYPISETVKEHEVIKSTFEIFGRRKSNQSDTLLMDGTVIFSSFIDCQQIELVLD